MSKQSCSYSSTRNGAENEVEDDSNEHLFDEVDDDASGSDYDDGTDEYEPEDEIQITENIIALAKSMSHVSDDDLLDMIALNKSSQELIQKLIDKTDRSLLDNMEALEEVHEELAALNSPNDASNFKVAIILYDRPYFKDNFGMTAVMNQEAAELIKTHKLPTLLREEVIWKLQELKELKTGVCWSLVSNLNKPLITKEALLSTKIKTFNAANTQEELSQWRAEVVELKRKIDFNKNTPLEELENAGYDNVDWNLIAHRFMDNERTPIQCKQKWLNELCLRINKGPWTDKEDAILKETACHSWTNWKFVVHELGTNRSEFMCIKRAKELYLKIYHEKQVWTPEEDEKLYSIVSSCRNIHSIPWEKVAKLLGSRNALQCKYRFTQSIDTRLHQGRWTDAEDMFLLDAINRYGPLDWAKIASSALNSPNDASNFKVAIILYDRPYFKDNFGMTAVMNQEAAELIKTHKLPTLLREEVIWKLQELKELKTGVCWSLVSNLNKPLITKEALLSTKIKTFNAANTQEELSQWRAEVAELKRKIDFNKNTPLEELENAGYDNVDWNLIAHRFMDNERTPIQCKQKWLNELCLRINKGPWTDKEDAILKETACHSWTNWKFVVHELGTNRSEFMCIKRAKELYLKIYHEKQVWTPEEDEKLYSIVSSCRNIHSIPWEKVAKLLGSRNALQCKYRFTQSIDTRLHQGRWTDAEDMFLLDAINRYGPLDWAKIASCVPGRTAAQCRTRWVNFLNLEREHKQWTALEDELLLRLIQILGRGKWSQMSLFFPGREPFDLRGRMKYFLTKRAKNKPLTYEDTSYRYKYAHTARIKTMMRFQQLENDSAMTNNEVFKRFGIGSFLLNDDQRPGSFKQKLKEFHIYQSGAYLKSRTTLDRRKARTLLETNKVMIRNSLYQYENTWRKVFNLSQKCQDYFKQKMTVTLPPMIVAPKPRDLNNYKEMLSDVMLPCRGTLMGVSQYRQNYRNNFRIAASKFFDGVD
uniref:snRNA-activating protein complex subunit 4 n=1 Tax=Panagrolaimus sp. JU765 TaxID=591449 RepID=A0AC34Q974_9BILA